eukprot:gnl/TRDRNA2_/TRDRNA2_155634_c0_seq1.p1 gnl/TRDRNA2_/TRDRNA2_155634_c0~~gnl/TRDRNA2_/TRDRNA2_155634_c0_seq1.p1  ORF type:complete len:345 (+),score=59.58 gnl/TRDRNA2_/TRDRNA2_155634_c0_seq1:113-1147(+)
MSAIPPAPRAPVTATSEVFEHRGWTFQADASPLWGMERRDELARNFQLVTLPEMYCGDSALRFRHASSNVSIELSAADAYRCCTWKPRPPAGLQPPCSSAKAMGCADVEQVPLLGTLQCQFAGKWKPRSENPDVKEMEVTTDWTSSTGYWGSLYNDVDLAAAAAARAAPDCERACPVDGANFGLETDTEEQLPMELLRRRDEIQWYQEILFWEDELGDNGLCRVSARVRVMPSFWFALLLCEVRVDNVLLREVATRYFCSFDSPSPKVLREWSWREASWEALLQRGVKLIDNPQVSQESVGTGLLSTIDVKLLLRHTIGLGNSESNAASDRDERDGIQECVLKC